MSETFPYRPPLEIGSIGRRSSGYWGMVFIVISEASGFMYLFFSYFYYNVQNQYAPWPPGGAPVLYYSAPQTAVLIVAGIAMWWAQRSVIRAQRLQLLLGLAATLVLALIFIGLQGIDWAEKPFGFATDPYSELYYTITGVHLAHVVLGVLMQIAILVWAALGYFGPKRNAPVMAMGLYWYFVAVIWFALFFTLYLTPYMG